VKNDDTLHSPASSVSFWILPNVTLSGNHVADLDVEHVKEKVVDFIANKRTKKNPQKL